MGIWLHKFHILAQNLYYLIRQILELFSTPMPTLQLFKNIIYFSGGAHRQRSQLYHSMLIPLFEWQTQGKTFPSPCRNPFMNILLFYFFQNNVCFSNFALSPISSTPLEHSGPELLFFKTGKSHTLSPC